jgi:hypothetical protein
MKVGDLVVMPGESLMAGEDMSMGLVIDDTDPRTHKSWPGKTKRVGIWWAGSDRIDFEPIDWLEVINESR